MPKFFFDLDGTIINSQERLYKLFCELCPENRFSYTEYWEIKRTHCTQKDLLKRYFGYNETQIVNFNIKFKEMVEEEYRLAQDVPIYGVSDVLFYLHQKYRLFIVTNRQNRHLTIQQISRLGWFSLFEKILVTEQKISKEDLILNNITTSSNDWMVSDTGEDIKTAKKLGIKSIAVTWGILNKNVLEGYSPDLLIDDVNELRGLP